MSTIYNALNKLFENKKSDILSVYFTSGFPKLDSTIEIIYSLEKHGADLVEIGIPFSDPVADGPIIQKSSTVALKNGMTLEKLLTQLEGIRNNVKMPFLLMGYFNPVLQYGVEKFCKRCKDIGIDGVIIPDLPFDLYVKKYKHIFQNFNLHFIFLVTPQTSDERIKMIDKETTGFIYAVSTASTTGIKDDFSDENLEYFKRLKNLNLKNPFLIGFGISNYKTYSKACNYANGVIIGSAFIKALSENNSPIDEIVNNFITKIKSMG